MQLGIDPRVDYACKLMLGSPDHSAVTVHFLNAMLRPNVPVVEVQILNPLVGKDRSEDKIVILDILAIDQAGRRFNIEMQTRLPLSFSNRLLYYNCLNFSRQIHEGEGYDVLSPAISICLLDRRMFVQNVTGPRWHHSFRLRCDQDVELVLTDDFEFHIFELPNFRPSVDNIRKLPDDEKWLYLFTNAATMDPVELADMLDAPAYREAIGVLQMISKSPEDLQYYEDRLKFLRDEAGKLKAAQEEGERIGLEKGEQRGLRKGELIGKLLILQELLGTSSASSEDLAGLDVTELAGRIDRLQSQLRDRSE